MRAQLLHEGSDRYVILSLDRARLVAVRGDGMLLSGEEVIPNQQGRQEHQDGPVPADVVGRACRPRQGRTWTRIASRSEEHCEARGRSDRQDVREPLWTARMPGVPHRAGVACGDRRTRMAQFANDQELLRAPKSRCAAHRAPAPPRPCECYRPSRASRSEQPVACHRE